MNVKISTQRRKAAKKSRINIRTKPLTAEDAEDAGEKQEQQLNRQAAKQRKDQRLNFEMDGRRAVLCGGLLRPRLMRFKPIKQLAKLAA